MKSFLATDRRNRVSGEHRGRCRVRHCTATAQAVRRPGVAMLWRASGAVCEKGRGHGWSKCYARRLQGTGQLCRAALRFVVSTCAYFVSMNLFYIDSLIALGECGLDYSPRFVTNGEGDKNSQREVLKRHVELGRRFDLPLFVTACIGQREKEASLQHLSFEIRWTSYHRSGA